MQNSVESKILELHQTKRKKYRQIIEKYEKNSKNINITSSHNNNSDIKTGVGIKNQT